MSRMKTGPKYDYHTEVREFVRGKPKVGLFEYFGAGKTWQTMQWLSDMLESGRNMLPALVVAPKNIVHQWGEQIAMHSDFSYAVADGSLIDRQMALAKDVDIYIINYASIRTGLRYQLFGLAGLLNSFIADESTYYKSQDTTRSKITKYAFHTIPHRAILTGRPITEDVDELWNQMHILDGGERLGTNYFAYRKKHFEVDQCKPFKYNLKEGSGEKIAAAVSDICIYVPREKVAAQLPPRNVIPVYFELPSGVQSMYDELRKTFRLEFESGAIVDTQWAFVKSAKLHQLCNGFIYTSSEGGGERDVETVATDKWDWLRDAVPSLLSQGPLIIWSPFRYQIMATQALLEGLGVNYARYMGGDDQAGIERFKSGGCDVILLSLAAANAGFNLQRARSAIYLSQPLSGEQRENSLARNYRLGSEIHDQCNVYDLICRDTVEDVIYATLAEKRDLGDAILNHLIH